MSNPLRELGVNIAIIQENRILLTRREDREAWCLPGGAVEFGEPLAEAAIRETFINLGYHGWNSIGNMQASSTQKTARLRLLERNNDR